MSVVREHVGRVLAVCARIVRDHIVCGRIVSARFLF